MDSSLLLTIATLIYGLSSLSYIIGLIFRKLWFALLGHYLAYFGFLSITFGILVRWYKSYDLGIGHIPLSNLYESLIFFAWILVVIYLFVEKKYKNMFIGSFVMPMAFLCISYASLSPNINSTIQPLVPALQSNWLTTHVVTCFFGYAAFSISFALSIIYILKSYTINKLLNSLPDIYIIEELNYQMVTFGFLFLSTGIITGSIWANSAWGSYWSWDPKETWSLITWLIYATLIHVQLVRKWRGIRIAFISIVGFIAVLFTYFGVNYLHGLHSYAKI